MFSLFNRSLFKSQSKQWQVPELPHLDRALYPLQWQQKTFASVYVLLLDIIQNPQQDYISQQTQFSKLLQQQALYQDWINFTVHGRYVQRSFSAFYEQQEDSFNSEMPEILKHALMRHAQRLPIGQVLLVGGNIHPSVRQEKLLIATLNPFKALEEAIKKNNTAKSKQIRSSQTDVTLTHAIVLNVITATSDEVKVFAVNHNKRTRDALRNEVMVLDFDRFTLAKEETINVDNKAQSETIYLIRHYNIS